MGAVSNAVDRRGGNDQREQRGSAVAVVSPDAIKAVLKVVFEYRGTFARLLPPHLDADTYLGIAASALWKNEKLAEAAIANPESLVVALRDCARLGHQPGTDQYALTVRKQNKRPGVLGIEQYQGVIERMYRAGAVQAVHAEVVCRGETFRRQDPAPPLHGVADWLDRDPVVANLVGAYAYAILEGGACSRVVSMGRAEIMRHREAAATHDIWDGNFGSSMWLKTVTHELEKWVPTSAEYRREQARAAAVMADAIQQTRTTPQAASAQQQREERAAVVIDGEPISEPAGDEPWPDTAQPPEPRCTSGCDNEAQDPTCPIHGDKTAGGQ